MSDEEAAAFESIEGGTAEPEQETKPAGADKRAHPRVPVHWQAAVILEGKPVFGKVPDLARGGMSFLCEINLTENSLQTIYLRVPTADHRNFHQVETRCQVCNVILVPTQGLYRMGLKFVELNPTSKQVLMGYLQAHGG